MLIAGLRFFKFLQIRCLNDAIKIEKFWISFGNFRDVLANALFLNLVQIVLQQMVSADRLDFRLL